MGDSSIVLGQDNENRNSSGAVDNRGAANPSTSITCDKGNDWNEPFKRVGQIINAPFGLNAAISLTAPNLAAASLSIPAEIFCARYFARFIGMCLSDKYQTRPCHGERDAVYAYTWETACLYARFDKCVILTVCETADSSSPVVTRSIRLQVPVR